ncbi:unnamed protein product [Discula destructiva]
MKGKTIPEHSMLMDKWSTKPADHNAKRMRNNQRRHRARVKSRMEELETRLDETSAKLEAAMSTISSLTAEVEALRSRQPFTLAPLPEFSPPVPDLVRQRPCSTPTGSGQRKDEEPNPSMTTPVSALDCVSSDDNCGCQGAPPPAIGESTISCSSAFQIIEQQNFSGLEVTTIRAWLGPGFRLKPGEACRVETNKLYEILDHITSPS